MKIQIGYYPPATAYEGWGVAVSLTGAPGTWKHVPAKMVTDFHGSSSFVAYDTKAEAKRAASRHAARLLGL